MGLSHIVGNKLLLNCRNRLQNPTAHLAEIKDWDFEELDYWVSESEYWGNLELPETFQSTLCFVGRKRCLDSLYLDILNTLHIPSLQCSALLFYPKEQLLNLFEKSLRKSPSNSTFRAFLTMLIFRLQSEGECERNKKEWLKIRAAAALSEICSLCIKHGKAKELLKWVFSHRHREWREPGETINIKKNLLILIEGNIAGNWENSFFDKSYCDIDYLSYLSRDVNAANALPESIFSDIFSGYHKCINDKFTSLSLSGIDYAIDRCLGYGEAFLKVNHHDILNKAKEEFNTFRCEFESWRGKANKHGFRDASKYCFILAGISTIITNTAVADHIRLNLFDLVRDEAMNSYHRFSQSYSNHFCFPFTILRLYIHHLDESKFNDFDLQLIEGIEDLVMLLAILDQSSDVKMSDRNKRLLKDRWDKEYPALQADYLSTHRKRDLENIEKLLNSIVS